MNLNLPSLPGSRILRAYGRLMYEGTKLAAGPMLRRLYNVRVRGLEGFPRTGPVIVAPNHLSFIDPIVIALVLPRHITYIGKAEYWDAWQTRVLFEMAGGIPVRREDPVRAQGSLAAGIKILQAERVLGIFPEGTRTPDGRLYKGKTGAARMALEVGCPIVPTGLVGTDRVLPKDARIPGLGPRVSVTFAKPMRVPPEARDDAGVLREFTDELMHVIAGLTGQEYRDRYAYTKRIGGPAPVPVGGLT